MRFERSPGGMDVELTTFVQHDRAKQTTTTQHVVFSKEGIRLLPGHVRYAWPSELDLMA